jgi:hypothetical protein
MSRPRVSEENGRHLFQRLDEVLGAHEATTLMGLPPPVGWVDVTTKRDIDALASTKGDTDVLENEVSSIGCDHQHGHGEPGGPLRRSLERELRIMSWRLITALIAVCSLVVAGIKP